MSNILYVTGINAVLTVYSNMSDGLYQVAPSHPQYQEIRRMLKEGDEEVFTILKRKNPNFEQSEPSARERAALGEDFVIYNGRRIENQYLVSLVKRLGGMQTTAVRTFLNRMTLNPRIASIQMLMEFLKHHHLPITVNGTFLGYKYVTADYRDVWTGKFDNHPGCENRMRRRDVTYDPNIDCSTGFHVGTLAYAQAHCSSDGHIVICEVDPFYVVSVPYDCEHQKLRTARYKVLCDFEIPLSSQVIYSTDGLELDTKSYFDELKTKQYDYGKLHSEADNYDDDESIYDDDDDDKRD